MELLKVNEFAVAYNLSVSKVRDMCQKGILPACKIGVGWRIEREKAEGVLIDLFDNKIAHKSNKPRQTRPIKVKPKRNFDFLAELSRARGKL